MGFLPFEVVRFTARFQPTSPRRTGGARVVTIRTTGIIGKAYRDAPTIPRDVRRKNANIDCEDSGPVAAIGSRVR